MYIIQLILNIVFFIINNIFSIFGFKTKNIENNYRTQINKVLNTPSQMLNNTNTEDTNTEYTNTENTNNKLENKPF